MSEGSVLAIYIAPAKGEPTIAMQQVQLIPGSGIQGDRYFNPLGSQAEGYRPDRQLTLIENEAIQAIVHDDGIQITPAEARRNIVTSGIRLNELVGHDFFIGTVKVRGIRLCEPCNYLAGRTDPRILTSMAHRGGLRAEILTEGFIHISDFITVNDE